MQPLVEENTLGHQRIGTVHTEAGAEIADVVIAYQRWGELRIDASGTSNIILVEHALTGDSNAVAWWPGIIGPGKALDTDIYCVMCTNVIGGCSGSTGPRYLLKNNFLTHSALIPSPPSWVDPWAGRGASNGRSSIPPLYDPHW